MFNIRISLVKQMLTLIAAGRQTTAHCHGRWASQGDGRSPLRGRLPRRRRTFNLPTESFQTASGAVNFIMIAPEAEARRGEVIRPSGKP